jgi:hypothetical protein
LGQHGENSVVSLKAPLQPACSTNTVGTHTQGVGNNAGSVVHPDGNVLPGFETNFIESVRLKFYI